MSAAAAQAIEAGEGMATRPPPPAPLDAAALATSIRILIEADAAAEEAGREMHAARLKWAKAMATVQLAQRAVQKDMPPGDEPLTLRISTTHVATVTKTRQGAAVVTRSRVIAGRAGA